MAAITKIADRAQETSQSAGTGAISLAGASTGFQTLFAGYGAASGVPYCIVDAAGNYEVGLGTLSAAAAPATGSLSRDTVITSSNGNALVNFPAGTKTVFSDAPGSLLAIFAAATVLSAAKAGQVAVVATGGGGLALAGPLYSRKSLVINGSAVIANRPAASGVPTGTPSYTNVDRWKVMLTSGTITSGTFGQITSPAAGFAHGTAIGCSTLVISGATIVSYRYYIRAADAARCAGKVVTLSALGYQNSGAAVTGTLRLYSAGAVNNFGSTTALGTPAGVSIPSGTATPLAWTVDLTSAANVIYGLMIQLDMAYAASAASHAMYVGNLQIEEGATVTPFDWRPAAVEEQECRQYYQTIAVYESRYASGGGTYQVTVTFPTMVTIPTITATGGSISGVLYTESPHPVDKNCMYISCGTTGAGDWGLNYGFAMNSDF